MSGISVNNESIFETLGFSDPGKCRGHVWQGEGRCPYCADKELGRQRNGQLTAEALEILHTILKNKQ